MWWSGIEADSQISKNKMFQEIPWRIHEILHGKSSYSHYGRLYYLLFINLQAKRNSQKKKKKVECIYSFPGGSVVKNPPAVWETWVQSLGQKDSLEEEMATPSSILAWKIPQTEEPGRLQSYSPWGHRVGHDLVTKQEHHHQQQIQCPVHFLYMGELYCLYP